MSHPAAQRDASHEDKLGKIAMRIIAVAIVAAIIAVLLIEGMDGFPYETYGVVGPAIPFDHGSGTWSQQGAIAAAEERLARTLEILRADGLDASGHVGDMHPIPAINDALLTFDADLIVISTHPRERSGWLRRD